MLKIANCLHELLEEFKRKHSDLDRLLNIQIRETLQTLEPSNPGRL